MAARPSAPPSGDAAISTSSFVDNDQADPLGTILVSSVADSLVEAPYRFGEERRAITVNSGDTLMALLTGAAVPRQDAYQAIEAMEEAFDPRRLRVGQAVEVTFSHEGTDTEFAALAIEPDVDTQVIVSRSEGGAFAVEELTKEFETRPVAARGSITSSLSASSAAAGVPYPVVMELIRAYSYAIDFQRDIQPGDQFEVLFDQEVDENGDAVRTKDVRFAMLTVSGEEIPIYRFETEHGVDYFDRSGESIRRLLMRTPIDGARMSSGFGMRHHPILGYSRMHRGVDFAAPTGTPIYAAGNGVVEFAARNSGYGNFIRIRHNAGVKTAYAHLNAFESGLREGQRVSQGDVIGYVGTTGQSTGPHLHYEVMRNGEQVDPMSLDLPTGDVLEGQERERFETYVASVDRQFANLVPDRQVADSSQRSANAGSNED
ncbi:M23 family metallopeptidase [Fodinicurvata sp. EGI_FJ10296]|uniref:M23 family metallopeptidase n=1 Tax=Fodinicurvata sp. EGI_FJ10296 TaxID=3231908 RepID=UPI003452F356